ncbi:MAG TPA: DUF6632 domain-containing protein [Gemmatimonadales bacterium]|jgi:hydrogenase/urease accessory protein HupE|nr:DUF6632 domain-containing protein [Gemmatimonadales bacterium]
MRERALRIVLVAFGLIALVGVYPLMRLWPAGWRWQPYHPAYEHMITVFYATLGLFLLIAARRPAQHRSLILFAGWSSLAHGAVMGIDALRMSGERGHLLGDVPALIIAGALVLLLTARQLPSHVD